LQSIGIDYIDESEVLTPADEEHHINKHTFKVPFVCGARNLGEALRRISEGAAFIRTKGEAGTGNVVEAVRHQRAVTSEIRKASVMTEEELYAYARDIQAPFHLLKETARLKRLPVVNFAAGGIATPGTQLLYPFPRPKLFVPTDATLHSTAALLRYVEQKADAALMMQLGCDGGRQYNLTPPCQRN
jgi:pyridoxal 5'-phosphate synthase pdxS subunit